MQRGRSPVSIKDLVQSGLLSVGEDLTFRDRIDVKAKVTADGISVQGQEFRSPSTAATAVLGGISANGWLCWRVRRLTQWTTLDELRREVTV